MKTRSTIAILVSGMLLFTACVPSLPFISGDGEEEEVVVRPVQSIERPTVAVERGSIIDAVRVLGRVVAENEEGLFFKQNGRLKGFYVQYNQAVVQGTLLADLETGALETQIQNSELSLQDQERNLSKARTQAATGQADVTLAELAVDEAERALEKAQELLVEAQGGPTALERAQAQTAFTTAKSDHDAALKALERARQDLIAFQQGASVGLKAQRELALSNAEEAFRTAETRLEQLQSGNPDTQVLSQQANLRAREQALETANQNVTKERDRLKQEITNKIEVYQSELNKKSVEIEDELDEVLDAIRQLGSRASDARDAFEALLKALDEAQNNLRDAMQDAMQEEVDELQRQRELEALLDQLYLMAIVEALDAAPIEDEASEDAQTQDEASEDAPQTLEEKLEGLTGAELARAVLEIVQAGLLQAKEAGRSLSSTKSRLQAAQEKLDEYVELKTDLAEYIEERNLQLVAPPSPGTPMAILWASREKARLDLQAAQLALDQGKAQASEATPAAQAELDRARFDLEQAREALANVGDELQLAYDTADVEFLEAEAALVEAEEMWNTIQSGVVPDKLQDAEAEVARKEAALQKAQANLEQALINAADAGNVLKLENDLKRATANHELLLEQLADARLVAPFDGVIQFIKGKAGEPVSAYGEIIGLADPTKLIITADLSDDDSAKVALEQVADITLDAFSSEILKGTITKLPTSLVTAQGVIQDRSIRLEIDWPKEGAEIGMLARVTITVQHKDDVLKVPIESVKRSGRRTYVEYMDGDIKRAKNVEIGIQTETEVEILSGLEEGFVILQGQ